MAQSSQQSEYVSQVKAENENLDPSVFVHASRLLAEEIDRVEKGFKYVEVHTDKKTKLAVKVSIPSNQYPKVNFVGKLLGPQGTILKRLQGESGCKMSICGRGSIRDRSKEEELRKSTDAKYAHLSEDLHVLVECFSEAPDAYSRMSGALTHLSKFMDPHYDPEQDPSMASDGQEFGAPAPRGRGRGGAPAPRGAPRGAPPRGAPRGAPPRGAPRGAPRGRGATSAASGYDGYGGYEEPAYEDSTGYGAYDAGGYGEESAYGEESFDYGTARSTGGYGDSSYSSSFSNGAADSYGASSFGKAPPSRGRGLGGDRSRPYTPRARGASRGAPRGGAPRGGSRGRGGF